MLGRKEHGSHLALHTGKTSWSKNDCCGLKDLLFDLK